MVKRFTYRRKPPLLSVLFKGICFRRVQRNVLFTEITSKAPLKLWREPLFSLSHQASNNLSQGYIYIYIYILLKSWVRIPPGAWIFVCCECRVLSGRGLCDELITRPEESYRLCSVVVCDLETSRMGAPYIYDISRLRVNSAELRAWHQNRSLVLSPNWN